MTLFSIIHLMIMIESHTHTHTHTTGYPGAGTGYPGTRPIQIKMITWPSWIAPALAHPVLDKATLLQRQRGNVGRRGGATSKPGTLLQ